MTNYTLTAAPGSFAWTGQNATTFFGYTLAAAHGAYLVAGSPAAAISGEALSDTISVSMTQSYAYVMNMEVVDTIKISLVDGTTAIYGLTVTEQARVSELVQSAWPIAVIQNMTISEVLNAAIGVTIMERLNISSVVAVQAKYGITISELISISDGLWNLLSGVIVDAMTIHGDLSVVTHAAASMTDTIVLTEALGQQLIMSITVSDTVELTDAQLIQAIYDCTLEDGVIISAGFVSPDGTFTTFAINTRTNAVSEYEHWVFNSFGKMGNRYIGANQDGIYELNGVDDDGVSIPAYVRSGLFQPGGSRYSAFKAAYLGMRINNSASDTYLKIVMGDGVERVYKAHVQDMHSSRVDLGKGLRSRYWAWELVTTGAEFDLESITFIPLVASRRVG